MEAPDWVNILPTINAALNTLALVLLVVGYAEIRRGRTRTHKIAMLSAFIVSIAFLGCYLLYHFALQHYTGSSSKKFAGTGFVRGVYFVILISHIILAAVVPWLASLTIYRGLKQQWERHKRLAKITFPIWLYVSVTGVIIYLMLYHFVGSLPSEGA